MAPLHETVSSIQKPSCSVVDCMFNYWSVLVIQGNSPITTTRVGYSDGWKDLWEYGERGKELKVPHYTSAAAVCDSNLPRVKATCLK
jgi:hypothetical protein